MAAKKNSTNNVKTTFQPHSQAKVEFYTTYLKRYLRIINRVSSIDHINIFDVFCGMGIYEDGGKGSPVAAFEVVEELVKTEKDLISKLTLHVNDIEEGKVENFRSYIDSKNGNNCVCKVEYFNLDVEKMFNVVIDKTNKSDGSTANLVFIDPYGYKNIRKDIIRKIMNKKGNEIILFLPIFQMYRFTDVALRADESKTQYLPLKQFIESFFVSEHPIRNYGYEDVLQYIKYIRDGLRLERNYLTSSYYIERNTSQYFALFFITKSIYGIEKILEVKWELNEESGSGFNIPEAPCLFSEMFAQEKSEANFERLKSILLMELEKQPLTNRDIYILTLVREYLPKHTNEVLRQLLSNDIIVVTEISTQKIARKNSFYVNWENYKQNDPRVLISIKK